MMQLMEWYIYALIASLLAATIMQINRHFQVDGLSLSCTRSLWAFVFLLPALFWMTTFPESNLFYLVAIACGILAVLADRVIFDAAAIYGARLATLFQAVKIILVFLLWLMIDEGARNYLVNNLYIAGGVVLCLASSIVALNMLRNNDASWQALKYVFPAGVYLTFYDILAKTSIGENGGYEKAALFALLTFFSGSIFAFSLVMWRQHKRGTVFLDGPVIKAGAVMGAVFALIIPVIVLAQGATPNPAYVSSILLLSIVWIMIYHKVRNIPDEGSVWAALLFVLSAAGLVLLTS